MSVPLMWLLQVVLPTNTPLRCTSSATYGPDATALLPPFQLARQSTVPPIATVSIVAVACVPLAARAVAPDVCRFGMRLSRNVSAARRKEFCWSSLSCKSFVALPSSSTRLAYICSARGKLSMRKNAMLRRPFQRVRNCAAHQRHVHRVEHIDPEAQPVVRHEADTVHADLFGHVADVRRAVGLSVVARNRDIHVPRDARQIEEGAGDRRARRELLERAARHPEIHRG